ncbi:tpr domain protein [Colletotrichum incanum]|uniref:Tpr domain protein n=1 Tax=Colletotrichum incanum TaxID=1573173 RepID=A0A167B1V0_COLIC|nr:tpr domain protein [Colletotrichum incanum]
MAEVKAQLGEADKGLSNELEQFVSLRGDKWDSFHFRKGSDVLVRYNLLQQVEGNEEVEWAGVTMHSLVRWRAKQNNPGQPWHLWYKVFVLAACCQLICEDGTEFRQHLVVHLQDVEVSFAGSKDAERFESFVGETLGRIYDDEGRWEDAEELFVRVMETRKSVLGEEHPDTLTSMANLASTYADQGRWKEAEELEVQVMETSKRVLGEEHPSTLLSMHNLAFTQESQGRWEDAIQLMQDCVHQRQKILGFDHPDTESSSSALTQWRALWQQDTQTAN